MDDANQTVPHAPASAPDSAPTNALTSSPPSAPTSAVEGDAANLMGPQLQTPGATPINATPVNAMQISQAAAATASRELQPLGQPATTRGLDAATWAGQSLVVAVVLGGIALVAFAIKRRQLSKQRGPMDGQLGGQLGGHAHQHSHHHAPQHEDLGEPERPLRATTPDAMPRPMAYGLGASDAMRDEIAALRAEIESARDEAVELRREVAALRAMVERGVQRDERGPQREDRGPQREDRGSRVVPPLYAGASDQLREPQPEPKPTRDGRDGHAGRDGIEQRVLALAARGESAISIAQRTGVPTGQVELMLNLARASGRA